MTQDAFDEWWDSNRKTLSPSNPCMTDSFEYWAWEGWHAALALTSTKCEVQPSQEHVAWMYDDDNKLVPLFTAPPQRPWVGLTDEEAAECWTTSATQTWKNFENALRSKNT